MDDGLRGADFGSPPTLIYTPVPSYFAYRPKYRLSLFLFALTLLSTLLVGTELAISYRVNAPIADSLALYISLWKHPAALAEGIPFAFTVMGILLAHEMGHYL